MIFKIALRNIMRQKRRTILSSITIAVGMVVFIAMNSILSGTDQGMIDNMVHLSTGALRLSTIEYEKNKQTYPLQYGITDIKAIESALKKNKQVKDLTRRTQFIGQLSNYADFVPVIGTVIDQDSDTLVFMLNKNIRGSWFSKDNEKEIIIGSGLAQDLGVKEGDYITLYALTKYDSRNADEFLIRGLIFSTEPSLNKSGVFITFDGAREFLDIDNLVTEIDVAINKRLSNKAFFNDIRKVEDDLQARFPSLSVSSFMEIGAVFFQVSKTKAIAGFFFMFIILLIAGVGIFNTVFMSVYERIREIGVLRAHGMKPHDINTLFILEGLITGLAGSTLGILSGSLVNLILTVKGLPLDKMAGNIDTGNFPVWGTIYGTWNFDALVFVFVFGVLVAVVASIIPARAAARLQVTKALRFN